MKKIFTFTLLGLLILSSLLIAQPARAAGNEYYVSTTGNDTNPGTIERPFHSIQKAADIATAGDTVYVRGGMYAEKVIVQNSGTANSYITFSSYPDETAVLDLSGMTMSTEFEGGFTINAKKYIQVLGFQVQNSANGFGIICYHADHCTLKNNKTSNTYFSGIAALGSTDVIMEGNEVQLAGSDSGQGMISVMNSSFVNIINNHVYNGGSGAGIDIRDGSHDVLAKSNEVDDINHTGINVDAGSSHTYNITLDSNEINNALNDGIALASEGDHELNHVSITNNVLYKNASSGITIGNGAIHDIYIINNTAYGNGIGAGGGGIDVENPDPKAIFIRNNILSKNAGFTINVKKASSTEVTISHNLLDGFKKLNTEQRGTNYIEADPTFYNVDIPNLRLLPGSPAIAAGTTLNAPQQDIADLARTGNIDIGAYQYNPSAAIPLFWDTFDDTFSGWEKTKGVTWYTGYQKLGSHSVLLTGNSSAVISVPTGGYEGLVLSMYVGTESYESDEVLSIDWWDGTVWQTIDTIANRSPKENGELNPLKIRLPAETSNRPAFKLRISQSNADKTDYAYFDSVEISGVLQNISASRMMIYSLLGLFILLGLVYLLKAKN